MKIRDVKKNVGFESPMLGDIRITGDTGWLADYRNNFALLDRFFVINYGMRDILTDTVSDFQSDTECVLYANKYTLDKLWDSLMFKYNPIYNVEEHTTETITNDNNITNDREEGQRERLTDNQYGKVKSDTRNVTGNQSQTVNNGEHNDNTSSSTGVSVAPFDTSTMHAKTQTQNSGNTHYGVQIVKTDTTDRTDTGTISTDAREDKSTVIDKPVNINDTRVEDLKQVLQRDREGNIGVMSAQSLIAEERQTALFNFWKEFFKIIVADCCMHVIADINPKLEGRWI